MANGILDLSAGGGSTPQPANIQQDLDKKVDKPLGQIIGAVAIVDPTGNDLEYRKFMAKDILVDIAGYKGVGDENELGLNDGDNNIQKIIDKLQAYTKAIIDNPDSGEAWVGGRKYPQGESFMITPTQVAPVTASGVKLKQGQTVLVQYAGTAPMKTASANLTLGEIATMEIVAGAGGNSEDVTFDDTISKLGTVATPITNIQKAIEALKAIVDKNPEQEFVADIAARDAIPNPKKGAISFVVDAGADASIGIGNGWANYIYTGTLWEKRLSKEDMKHIVQLTLAQFDPANPLYDTAGSVSAKQLDIWMSKKKHPQQAEEQVMTGDASLQIADATFATIKPTADNFTLVIPAPTPENMARIMVNPTEHPIILNQTGVGNRGTLPPFSTNLVNDDSVNVLPTDNAVSNHIHLTKALVGAVDEDAPTTAEITGGFAGQKKIFGYYTGTDVATDPIRRIYHIDAGGHIILVESDDSQSKADVKFITDADVGPAVAQNATVDEFRAWVMTRTVKQRKDNIFLYTGTTNITDEPKIVFRADADGDLALMDRNELPQQPSKIEFAGVTALAPADPLKVTPAEISAFATTNKHRETVIKYTGTDTETDVIKKLFYVDNYFNVVELSDSQEKITHNFISEVTVGPAIATKATFAEVEAKIKAQVIRDEFFYYTGTNTATDPVKGIYHIDEDGNVLELNKSATQKERIFLDRATLAPADVTEPTTAEILAKVGTKFGTLAFYTGTNNETDEVARAYWIDDLGKVTVIYKRPKVSEKRDIVLVTDAQINPVKATKAKVAEVKVYLNTIPVKDRKNKIFLYTGTADINDRSKIIFSADADGDIVKTEDDILPQPIHFVKDTVLDPLASLLPTEQEVKIYAVNAQIRDTIIRYTGTDDTSDETLRTFMVDHYGNVTLLGREPFKVNDRAIFLSKTDMAAADPLIPTISETRVVVGNKGIKSHLVFYTGTDSSTDEVTQVYFVDKAGVITIVYDLATIKDKLERKRYHIGKTALSANKPEDPLIGEIQSFVTTKGIKNRIVYYTGTDNGTNPATYAYHSDADGLVTQLFHKHIVPPMPNKTVFLKESEVAPLVAGKPTIGEAQAIIGTKAATDIFYTYNGTELDTNEHSGIYYVDVNNNVTVIKDPKDANKDQVESVHFVEADVGPAIAKNATVAEVMVAIDLVPTVIKHNKFYTYTGTDVATDPVKIAVFVDASGDKVLLVSPQAKFNHHLHLDADTDVDALVSGQSIPAGELLVITNTNITKSIKLSLGGGRTLSLMRSDGNAVVTKANADDFLLGVNDMAIISVNATDWVVTVNSPLFTSTVADIAGLKAIESKTLTGGERAMVGSLIWLYDIEKADLVESDELVIPTDAQPKGRWVRAKSGGSGDYIAVRDIVVNGNAIPLNSGEAKGDKYLEIDTNKIWVRDIGLTYHELDLTKLADGTRVVSIGSSTEYRWDRPNAVFLPVTPAMDLYGEPVATIATLLALPARENEHRYVIDVKKPFVFTKGATPTSKGYPDVSATGAWEIESAEPLLMETSVVGTAIQNMDKYFDKSNYPLTHTSFFVPNADVKIQSTGTNKMFIYLNGLLTPALSDLQEYQMLSTDIVYISSPSVGRINVFITRTIVKPPKKLLFGGSRPNTAIRQNTIDGHILASFATPAPASDLVMENGYTILPVGTYRISAVLCAKDMNSSDYCRVKLIDVGNNKKLIDSPTLTVVGGSDTMTITSGSAGNEEAYSKSINMVVKVTAETKIGLWLYQYNGGWTFNYEHSGMSINQLPEETVIDASMQVANPYTIKVTGDATTVNGGNALQNAYEDSGVVAVQIDTPAGKFIKNVIDQDGNAIAVNDGRSGVVYVNRTTGQGDIVLTATLDDIPAIIGDLIAYTAQGSYDNATSSTLTFHGDPKAKGISHDTATGEFTALVDMIIDISLIDGIKSNFNDVTLELRMLDNNGKAGFVQEENSRDYREIKYAVNDTWKEYKFDFNNFKVLAGQKFSLICFVAGSGFDGGTFSQLTIKGIKI